MRTAPLKDKALPCRTHQPFRQLLLSHRSATPCQYLLTGIPQTKMGEESIELTFVIFISPTPMPTRSYDQVEPVRNTWDPTDVVSRLNRLDGSPTCTNTIPRNPRFYHRTRRDGCGEYDDERRDREQSHAQCKLGPATPEQCHVSPVNILQVDERSVYPGPPQQK